MIRLSLMSWVAISSLLLLPLPVWAHIGPGHSGGLGVGFVHPIGGLDHLLAMLAVGFWAAQLGCRSLWAVPTAFIAMMIAGFLLGMVGAPIPMVEQGILASVVVLGLLVAAAWKLPWVASSLIVGLFALCHGHAHGAEMPLSLSGLEYAIGFISATAILHVAGLGLGMLTRGSVGEVVGRLAGVATMLIGLYLVVG